MGTITQYKAQEVWTRLSVKKEDFENLLNNGFIVPSIKRSKKLESNIFSKEDIYRIQIFFLLTFMGIASNRASAIAKNYNPSKSKCKSRLTLLWKYRFFEPECIISILINKKSLKKWTDKSLE